jgi:hypothetical protein
MKGWYGNALVSEIIERKKDERKKDERKKDERKEGERKRNPWRTRS